MRSACAALRRGLLRLLHRCALGPGRRRSALLAWLALLGSLVVVWAFFLHEIGRERDTAIHDGQVQALNQAQVFAEYSRSTIRRIDEYLLDLRAQWNGDDTAFSDVLQRHHATLNDVSFQVGVIDRNGFLAYSSLGHATQRVDLRERAHYRVHAERPQDDRLYISDPVLGRVSGKWAIQFTRPLLANGRFDGVIVISVDPEHFAGFASHLNVSNGGSITVFKDSGRIIARRPAVADALGRTLKGGPLLGASAPPSGHFRARSQTDGIERIYGYQQLPEYGLVAAVGVSLEQVLAPFEAHRLTALRAASVMTVLLFALGHLLWRFGAERRRAQEQARIASLVYEASSEGMVVTSADGYILAVNPAFTALTGYSAEEAVGKTPAMLRSGRHDRRFYVDMWAQILATGRWQGEIWNRRKNGEVYPEWLTVSTTSDASGQVIRRVGLFADISEKKKREDLIWQQANFDILTALPNRRMFGDRLDLQIKRAQRAGSAFALLLLDLDRFKEVNDSLGHHAGDALLVEVATRLRACVRDTDTVARLGGDEFTIILADAADGEAVQRVVDTLQRALAEPVQLNGEVVYTSASVGVTFYPRDAADAESLVKQADQAMFAAKALGVGHCSFFTPAMQEAVHSRMRMMADLRVALAQGQFSLHYQPIVDLRSGQIRKAEALLRWVHPTRGPVSPAQFISVAEDSGLIEEIGDWVFNQALEDLAAWRRLPHAQVDVSVNMSPLQLRGTEVAVARWPERLGERGLPLGSMVIEITESSLMEAHASVAARMQALRAAGMQLSLDDFGTGYSSLAYLRKFRIDFLKIDQSFVRALHRDSADTALCEAIIVMAHKLGIRVVAEGVETAYQRDFLREAGCDYAQGYLFSPPVDRERFEQLLRGGAVLNAPAGAEALADEG